MSGLRRAGAADCLCRERNELLREVPDWRKVVGGSLAVALTQGRLAAQFGGVGGDTQAENAIRWCASAPYGLSWEKVFRRVRLRTIFYSPNG